MPRTTIALIYDFDGTLAPGNMQEHSFLPDINISKEDFWAKVDKITEQQKLDNILVYMDLMIKESHDQGKSISRQNLKDYGKNIQLYKGVAEWFDLINVYAKRCNVNLEHYIISAGNKEILEGLPITKYFKQIYGCKFIFDERDIATGCGLAVNYTTKTQFLFRINKRVLNEHDVDINKYTPKQHRPVPFRNMIFIGDGETDIPSFRLVKEYGGHSIAVYEPQKLPTKDNLTSQQKAEALKTDGRVNFIAETDYTEHSNLHKQVTAIINKITADNAIAGLNLQV